MAIGVAPTESQQVGLGSFLRVAISAYSRSHLFTPPSMDSLWTTSSTLQLTLTWPTESGSETVATGGSGVAHREPML